MRLSSWLFKAGRVPGVRNERTGPEGRFRAGDVEATVGIDRVKVWHLNDSKKELGSRVDRHEHIGRGTIGIEGFKPIVRDPAFVNVPKILETAKAKDEAGRDWDAVNLEVLTGLM